MVFTFLKARGLEVGSSLVEEDKLELAKSLEAKAKAKGVKLILPTDVILADKFAADANTKVCSATSRTCRDETCSSKNVLCQSHSSGHREQLRSWRTECVQPQRFLRGSVLRGVQGRSEA